MRRRAVLAALLLAGCARGDGAGTVFPGTIEVDEVDAAPMVGGRIARFLVDEGDSVRAGDTVAVLTQTQLPATVAERQARLASARARLADLRRGARAPERERAEAELAAAEAEAGRTARELARAEQLAAQKIIPAQQLDQAQAAAAATARRRDAARAALDLIQAGSREDMVRAAESEVQSAAALLSGATADQRELVLIAPTDGIVLGRHADPGEVVPAGTPLATIGVVGRKWVRVYLPAALLARLAPGARAEVVVSGTREGVPGRLGAVNPRAEFTPRAALTEEERADLLFAARIELDAPPPTLRPGLPVTVRFTAGAAP